MSELKPCPFAHDFKIPELMPPEIRREDDDQGWLGQVQCWHCGALGPAAESEQEAIDAWNTRVEENG